GVVPARQVRGGPPAGVAERAAHDHVVPLDGQGRHARTARHAIWRPETRAKQAVPTAGIPNRPVAGRGAPRVFEDTGHVDATSRADGDRAGAIIQAGAERRPARTTPPRDVIDRVRTAAVGGGCETTGEVQVAAGECQAPHIAVHARTQLSPTA